MKSIRAVLQFTTTLPLGEPADFDSFAKKSWLYPIAGYVTGAFAALPGVLAWYFGYENSFVIAALTLAVAIIISGANHFDGLLDFGDGLMAHGSSEKRISAMTDKYIGAGGVAAGVLVLLLAFAGLSALTPILIATAVFSAEVLSKMVMGLFSALGKPFRTGIHSYIYENSKRRFAGYTILLALPLFLIPETKLILGGFFAAFFTFMVLYLLARRCFGGVNGDVVGASGEITRAMVVLVFALLL